MSGSLEILIEDGSTSLAVVVEDNPRIRDFIPISAEEGNQLVRNIDGYYVPPTAWDDIVDGPESSSSQVDDTVNQVPILTNVVGQHTQQIEQLDQNKVDVQQGYGLSQEDFTTAFRNKLEGVAAGATANATDAQLRDRSTHTGMQPISSVTGLQQELDDINGLIGDIGLVLDSINGEVVP